MGIKTIGDILGIPLTILEKKLGKWGVDLYNKARGIHNGQVNNYHEAKSISTESTFEENTSDMNFLLKELVRMTERVGFELRREEKLTGCVAVKIRYANFETTTKQATINFTFSDDELIVAAMQLFHQLYKSEKPVRLLGVRLSEISSHSLQGSLFDSPEKKVNLYKAIDDVKNKYGRGALKRARS